MSDDKKYRSQGPELLDDMAKKIAQILVELLDLDKDISEQVGIESANRMSTEWGGQMIYFPMGVARKISARDAQIYIDFTGSNHADLAKKYGISIVWLYKIIKTMRKADLDSRQNKLFPPPEA
jgi:Mor family transcriptional regulator